jgi:hypothetical protein
MVFLSQHLKNISLDIVVELEIEFRKLHQQYFLGKWEPSQLDAGRFAEHVFRVLEYIQTKAFTPIGTIIPRLSIYNSISKDITLPESIRFHILKLADLILDFRNKRNVAHPGTINVNEMDSTFVLHASNWIIAELIRLETQMSPADAQTEIKKIIEKKVPVIEEVGGRLKCLDPKLDVKGKSLLFCYQKYPQKIALNDIYIWTDYSNKGVLRKYLNQLSKLGLVDFKNDFIQLTRRGILWVEKNISFELEL